MGSNGRIQKHPSFARGSSSKPSSEVVGPLSNSRTKDQAGALWGGQTARQRSLQSCSVQKIFTKKAKFLFLTQYLIIIKDIHAPALLP